MTSRSPWLGSLVLFSLGFSLPAWAQGPEHPAADKPSHESQGSEHNAQLGGSAQGSVSLQLELHGSAEAHGLAEAHGSEDAHSAEPAQARAEAHADEKAEPEPPGLAGIDWVYGWGSLREERSGLPFDYSAQSLVFGFRYQLDSFLFGLRLPISSATVQSGDEHSWSNNALGNVEASIAKSVELAEHLEFEGELGVVLPSGRGDRYGDETFRHLAEVQELAAASRGFEDDALFMPRHLGLVPKLSLLYRQGPVRASVSQKFEVLQRAGALRATAPDEDHTLAVASVSAASVDVSPGIKALELGVRSWLYYGIQESYETGREPDVPEPSKLQWMLEPRVQGHLGAIKPSVGVLLPLGGRLADPGLVALRFGLFGQF